MPYAIRSAENVEDGWHLLRYVTAVSALGSTRHLVAYESDTIATCSECSGSLCERAGSERLRSGCSGRFEVDNGHERYATMAGREYAKEHTAR